MDAGLRLASLGRNLGLFMLVVRAWRRGGTAEDVNRNDFSFDASGDCLGDAGYFGSYLSFGHGLLWVRVTRCTGRGVIFGSVIVMVVAVIVVIRMSRYMHMGRGKERVLLSVHMGWRMTLMAIGVIHIRYMRVISPAWAMHLWLRVYNRIQGQEGHLRCKLALERVNIQIPYMMAQGCQPSCYR